MNFLKVQELAEKVYQRDLKYLQDIQKSEQYTIQEINGPIVYPCYPLTFTKSGALDGWWILHL